MVIFPTFCQEIATSPTAPRNDTVVVFFCVFIWRASSLNNHLLYIIYKPRGGFLGRFAIDIELRFGEK